MARLPYPNYHTPHAKPRRTINILKLLSYSPATINHWSGVGNGHFGHLLLSPRHRELVILLTTAKFKSTYEWTHHLSISRKAGVTPAQQEALAESATQTDYFVEGRGRGCSDAGFSAKDMVLLEFVETVIQGPEVGDELWERVRGEFGEREVVEVMSLLGFYYMFSRLSTVLQCDFEDWAKAKL